MSRSPAGVVVLGGGVAGAATALALARAGVAVTVIDHGGRPPLSAEAELLGPGTRPVLSALGVWPEVALGVSAAWAVERVWGDEQRRAEPFLAIADGTAWIVDRRLVAAALGGAARAAGARWMPASSPGRGPCDDAAAATEAAAAVVDATGRRAAFARHLGCGPVVHDRLVATVLVIEGRASPSTLLVEATRTGWWYSLPAGDDRLVVAWLTDSDLAAAGPPDPLTDGARHTARRLDGSRTLCGPRRVSARGQHVVAQAAALRAGQPLWLPVGDAALAHDPLSGGGLAHALSSAVGAAATVVAHLGGDAGAVDGWARAHASAVDGYLQTRSAIYGSERRWPAAPFWRRRHGVTPGAAASAELSPGWASRGT